MGMSVWVSVCPQAYLLKHMRDLYDFLCMLPMAVAQSSAGGVMKSQGRGNFGGFLDH